MTCTCGVPVGIAVEVVSPADAVGQTWAAILTVPPTYCLPCTSPLWAAVFMTVHRNANSHFPELVDKIIQCTREHCELPKGSPFYPVPLTRLWSLFKAFAHYSHLIRVSAMPATGTSSLVCAQ